ncbi:MAG: hypothetical protein OQK99_11480 [Gammaproteobacteria bacterium]|jgi:hypothetical protein|nr:hypothetical protein [Gammaproteobacteria bacterium]
MMLFLAKTNWHSALPVVAACLAAALLISSAAAEPVDEIHRYSVLLIGNSHSSRAGLPVMLEAILEAGDTNTVAEVKALGHWAFLAERLDDNTTQKALDSRNWTHVVLQAQKYSTTGKYSYPTDAAEKWIRRIRDRGAQPILFPEWARREHPEEALRIHCLHLEISSRESAPVAPVGLAWQIMRDAHPDIALYDRDGNHANRRGALLTAYVLYSSITGESPAGLPYVKIRRVPEETQAVLRAAANMATGIIPACTPDSTP